MVSVLKVGADDASSGNNEKPISPRMMNKELKEVDCLPATFNKINETIDMCMCIDLDGSPQE